MNILSIKGLTKKYGRITAVNQLNLEVERGMIYGILGPNGSGKTTTLGIILGITKADEGSYEWFNQGQEDKHRLKLGALLETPNFYPYLDAVDNLQLIAHIKKVKQPKIDELLKLVNLHHRRHSKFRTYSLGMKQRLAIAGAMVGDPEVLLFDEPTNGLDPQGIAEVRDTLKHIASTGKTIIMASHILDEVEKICSHVAIIKNGRLLAAGTVGSIIHDDHLVEIAAADHSVLQEKFSSFPGLRQIEVEEDRLILYLEEETAASTINRFAFDQGITLSHLRVIRKSLESEFLEITANEN
jgi:ABC-2 type transport system ATP-binding protein